MSETKKEFRYFTIFNHQKEEAYLRQKHNEGWRFVKVSGIGIYHFEKCEPEDVIYQLDYHPQTAETKADYLKMFSDCGWSYLQEYAGYSYFRKAASEMQGEETIFSDDSSRLAMMGRVYKGRLLPLLVIFSACLLPQFILNMVNGNYFLSTILGAILLSYGVFFAACAMSYYRQLHK